MEERRGQHETERFHRDVEEQVVQPGIRPRHEHADDTVDCPRGNPGQDVGNEDADEQAGPLPQADVEELDREERLRKHFAERPVAEHLVQGRNPADRRRRESPDAGAPGARHDDIDLPLRGVDHANALEVGRQTVLGVAFGKGAQAIEIEPQLLVQDDGEVSREGRSGCGVGLAQIEIARGLAVPAGSRRVEECLDRATRRPRADVSRLGPGGLRVDGLARRFLRRVRAAAGGQNRDDDEDRAQRSPRRRPAAIHFVNRISHGDGSFDSGRRGRITFGTSKSVGLVAGGRRRRLRATPCGEGR